jgi:hypothetical protein
MNFLTLFKKLIFPHLWLNHNIIGIGAGTAIAGGLGALGGLLGSGSSGDAESVSGFKALPKFLRKEFRNELIPQVNADFAQGPQEFFPGQTFADLTPDQLAGLQQQLQFSGGLLPQQLGQVNQSFGNALNAGNLYQDPSVQAGLGTIENRANQNFQENILPNLRQQATGTGNQFSSKAEQSERLAGRDLQQVISDSQGSFLANQLASGRALQSGALGQAPNITQLGLLPGANQFNVGSVLQGQDQLQSAEDVARFNFGQQAGDANLDQLIARLTGIAGAGGGAGFQSTPTGGTNPLAGALGGGLLASQLYNQLQPSFGSTGGGTGFQAFSGANGADALGVNSGNFSNFGGSFGGLG